MTIHGSLFHDFLENSSQDPFSLQGKKLLKIQMGYGPVWAKTGSMVAYQGDVRFENKGSGGLGKMLKSAVTGEGVDMMQCTGQGDLFVADNAADVQILYLENDALSINGNNVLAFSSSIEWDIHRVQARGAAMAGACTTWRCEARDTSPSRQRVSRSPSTSRARRRSATPRLSCCGPRA
jgi:uncharacterized protein (AIM24 family)